MGKINATKLQNISIDELNLSVRSKNCLLNNGILTICQLLLMSETELATIKNLGVASFKEIKHKLFGFFFYNPIGDYCKILDIKFCEEMVYDAMPFAKRILLKEVHKFIENTDRKSLYKIIENKQHTNEIISSFVAYSQKYDFSQVKVSYFNQIPHIRLNQKISNYLILYPNSSKIKNLFNKIEYVHEIIDGFDKFVNDGEFSNEVKQFANWLSKDIITLFDDFYSTLFKKDRDEQIIIKRLCGSTLEQIGDEFGLTRERVRQIESKVIERFTKFNSENHPISLIAGDKGYDIYVSCQTVIDYIGEKGKVLCYLLENDKTDEYVFNKKNRQFIVNSHTDADLLKSYVSSLDDEIWDYQIENICTDICNLFNISSHALHQEVENQFNKTGKMYHRGRLTLTKIYEYTLKKYYPNGIKLEDAQRKVFIDYIKKDFGDSVEIPQNKRAIDARISDIAVLCDRGSYIHKEYLKVDPKLLNIIENFIDESPRIAFSFLEIYDIFKSQIEKLSNITNRYYLQGALKQYCKNKYYFSRDYISKDKDINFEHEIKNFVKSKGCVSKTELFAEFCGLTEAMLAQTIIRCDEIIAFDMGKYIYYDTLNLKSKDFNDIKKCIEDRVKNHPVSSRKLMEDIQKKYENFLKKNNITTHYNLFGVLKYMFKNEYKFSRPFIYSLDEKEVNKVNILKGYIKENDYIKISGLIEYCQQEKIIFQSWSYMLKCLQEDYIRISENILVPVDAISLDEYSFKKVYIFIKDSLKKCGYINIRDLNDFSEFPTLNYKWTSYLLKSIVERYFDDIVVIDAHITDVNTINSFLVNKELRIYTYKELILFALMFRQMKKKFSDLNHVRKYMEEKLYCSNDFYKTIYNNKHFQQMENYIKIK